MDGLLMLVVSAVTPWLLERLKHVRWFPLMQPIAPVLNRVTPAALAALVASGISYSFDGGTLTISGLVPDQIVRGLLLWVVGAGTQHVAYVRAIR